MSIWVKICKYLDLGQNFEKFRFWSIFMKILILVKIHENLDCGIWNLSENYDLGQHFRKISILVNIFGKIALSQNFPQILVLVKISEKMSIWVKIVEKSQIWSNLSKNLDFGQICRKFSILVKIKKNVDFGQKMRKC